MRIRRNAETKRAPVGRDVQEIADKVLTPAFVVDEGRVLEAVGRASKLAADTGCRVLYALKAQSGVDVLHTLRPLVSGFATSSLFEAELARSVLGQEGSVHVTTPAFRPGEVSRLNDLCDYVALNSISQLERIGPRFDRASVGLRINPERSFVKDPRYDPCGRHSKLGVPLRDVAHLIHSEPDVLDDVDGIHFHSNCDSISFQPLLDTVKRISARLDGLLRRVSWVNLGGGYLFASEAATEPFCDAIELLTSRHGVETFVEPGAAFVRRAGSLVASVIDLVRKGRETMAYLDTTVNHMPEVYEYQYEPEVLGHRDKGKHWYRLVGNSCLAGDVFGRYAFEHPLEVGSTVIFGDVGAYAAVKAHMFNGINLPTTYLWRTTGELVLRKQFSYSDFAANWGEGTIRASL
jgi:carboxynorspermidine decarboxylase